MNIFEDTFFFFLLRRLGGTNKSPAGRQLENPAIHTHITTHTCVYKVSLCTIGVCAHACMRVWGVGAWCVHALALSHLSLKLGVDLLKSLLQSRHLRAAVHQLDNILPPNYPVSFYLLKITR